MPLTPPLPRQTQITVGPPTPEKLSGSAHVVSITYELLKVLITVLMQGKSRNLRTIRTGGV